MMERGCRSFAFISRSGAEKPQAGQVVETLVNAGASVRVFKADATNETEVANILAELSASQTIRGVVHAAMVLQVRHATQDTKKLIQNANGEQRTACMSK